MQQHPLWAVTTKHTVRTCISYGSIHCVDRDEDGVHQADVITLRKDDEAGHTGGQARNPTVAAAAHRVLSTDEQRFISWPRFSGEENFAIRYVTTTCRYYFDRSKDDPVFQTYLSIIDNHTPRAITGSGGEVIQRTTVKVEAFILAVCVKAYFESKQGFARFTSWGGDWSAGGGER